MSVSSNRIAGLVLGSLVTLAAAAAPATAAGLTAPTDPALARWLGVETGTEFVLGKGRSKIQIGNFQEPRRVRVCVVEHTTPAFLNVDARIIADGRQIVVPVAHCGEIAGKHITAEAAGPLGGKRRVAGIYRVMSWPCCRFRCGSPRRRVRADPARTSGPASLDDHPVTACHTILQSTSTTISVVRKL